MYLKVVCSNRIMLILWVGWILVDFIIHTIILLFLVVVEAHQIFTMKIIMLSPGRPRGKGPSFGGLGCYK